MTSALQDSTGNKSGSAVVERRRVQSGRIETHSRSHDAVIRVYDDAGNVIEMRENKRDFKEW